MLKFTFHISSGYEGEDTEATIMANHGGESETHKVCVIIQPSSAYRDGIPTYNLRQMAEDICREFESTQLSHARRPVEEAK